MNLQIFLHFKHHLTLCHKKEEQIFLKTKLAMNQEKKMYRMNTNEVHDLTCIATSGSFCVLL